MKSTSCCRWWLHFAKKYPVSLSFIWDTAKEAAPATDKRALQLDLSFWRSLVCVFVNYY